MTVSSFQGDSARNRCITLADAGTVSDRFSALRRSTTIAALCPSALPRTAPAGPGGNDGCGPASPSGQTAARSKHENPERPRPPARKPPHPLPCLTCPSLPQLPRHPIVPTVVVILGLFQAVQAGQPGYARMWGPRSPLAFPPPLAHNGRTPSRMWESAPTAARGHFRQGGKAAPTLW